MIPAHRVVRQGRWDRKDQPVLRDQLAPEESRATLDRKDRKASRETPESKGRRDQPDPKDPLVQRDRKDLLVLLGRSVQPDRRGQRVTPGKPDP